MRAPQAMPTMGLRPKLGTSRLRATPATTEPRLKKLEDNAGMKNLPRVLRMPMTRAAKETSSRKGNMIWVIRMVRSDFPGIRRKSGAIRCTRWGEKNMPRRIRLPTSNEEHMMTLLARRQVRAAPDFWS